MAHGTGRPIRRLNPAPHAAAGEKRTRQTAWILTGPRHLPMRDERDGHRGQFRACQNPLTDLVGLPFRDGMSARRHRSRFVIRKNRHLIEPAGFWLAGDNEFRFATQLRQFRTRPDRWHELQSRRPVTMHTVALEHWLHRCKTSGLRSRRHTTCQGIQRCQRHHGNTDRSFHECRRLRCHA